MAMIEGFRVKNFKALKDVTLGKVLTMQQATPLTPMTAVIGKNGVERVSFLPTFINSLAQPEALNQEDDRFHEILSYMEWLSDQFPHTFKMEGNEIVVKNSG